MTIIMLLLTASIAGIAASIQVLDGSDLMWVFGPISLFSAVFFARHLVGAPHPIDPEPRNPLSSPVRRPGPTIRPRRHKATGHTPRRLKAETHPGRKLALIDGSNVMYWQDGTPRLEPVQEAIRVLSDRGFSVGVMFDADAGDKLFGRSDHDGAFGELLGVAEDRVMVMPEGTPADPYILTAARDYGACVVTNDTFRGLAEQFPEVHQKGYLVSGVYSESRVRLFLEA